MMRIKCLTAAMGAAVFGFYLLFSGCVLYPEDETPPPTEKSIIITGLGNTYKGKAAVIMLASSLETFLEEEPEVDAIGGIVVSGSTLTLPLYTSISESGYGPRWKGTGDFIIMLGFATQTPTGEVEPDKMFLYSDVVPYNEADILKYRITDAVSTIPFTEFLDVTDYL
jgi:hypothetical protein